MRFGVIGIQADGGGAGGNGLIDATFDFQGVGEMGVETSVAWV